ncbi:hypothetical protein BKA70DRAFT_1253411 [Coprinopsis sp. MPI-PUGE-AT-0042]|nr:hypothetical protein BKA70DRAFT_1253411 [Coprinopsis sp. MPI-PUGE-AT-0042]
MHGSRARRNINGGGANGTTCKCLGTQIGESICCILTMHSPAIEHHHEAGSTHNDYHGAGFVSNGTNYGAVHVGSTTYSGVPEPPTPQPPASEAPPVYSASTVGNNNGPQGLAAPEHALRPQLPRSETSGDISTLPEAPTTPDQPSPRMPAAPVNAPEPQREGFITNALVALGLA